MENKANRGLGFQSCCLKFATHVRMYVEEKNFCGEEEELDLGIFVLIFKHHNF